MRVVQDVGQYRRQFEEITQNALDKRSFIDTTSPGTSDTEFSITHGLGHIPVGFIVISQDKAAITYKGTTAWTANLIYLKTNVATVALRLLIF